MTLTNKDIEQYHSLIGVKLPSGQVMNLRVEMRHPDSKREEFVVLMPGRWLCKLVQFFDLMKERDVEYDLPSELQHIRKLHTLIA